MLDPPLDLSRGICCEITVTSYVQIYINYLFTLLDLIRSNTSMLKNILGLTKACSMVKRGFKLNVTVNYELNFSHLLAYQHGRKHKEALWDVNTTFFWMNL